MKLPLFVSLPADVRFRLVSLLLIGSEQLRFLFVSVLFPFVSRFLT
jgi:hypothetical protein